MRRRRGEWRTHPATGAPHPLAGPLRVLSRPAPTLWGACPRGDRGDGPAGAGLSQTWNWLRGNGGCLERGAGEQRSSCQSERSNEHNFVLPRYKAGRSARDT